MLKAFILINIGLLVVSYLVPIYCISTDVCLCCSIYYKDTFVCLFFKSEGDFSMTFAERRVKREAQTLICVKSDTYRLQQGAQASLH